MRQKPDWVQEDYVTIQRGFMHLHEHAVLVADVMFVNSIAFLIAMSRKIKFVTAQ